MTWHDVTPAEPRDGETVMLRFADGTEGRGYFVTKLDGFRAWYFEDGTWRSSLEDTPKWSHLENTVGGAP